MSDDEREEVLIVENWVNGSDDYLLAEPCYNCSRLRYNPSAVYCDRCGKSNELLMETVHHCLDCVLIENGNGVVGFDLCEPCYKLDPKFVKRGRSHKPDHYMNEIKHDKILHCCALCCFYFCEMCRIDNKNPIMVCGWKYGRDESELWNLSICKKCMSQFSCPFMKRTHEMLVDKLELPPEILYMIKKWL